jgi:hypothetical protein
MALGVLAWESKKRLNAMTNAYVSYFLGYMPTLVISLNSFKDSRTLSSLQTELEKNA